ncbi:MAG: phosphate acyltransferase, partial [Mucinivorans sp.]
MDLLERIKEQARSNKKRIVLPEATEQRTMRAANELLGDGIVDLTLIGNREK